MRKIDSKEFALAVVSGNPCPGNNPKEISENAIQLYLSALKVAKDFNEQQPLPKAAVQKKPSWLQ